MTQKALQELKQALNDPRVRRFYDECVAYQQEQEGSRTKP
jgi:hypothetical protein